jgi:hypothetical protein
MPASRRSRSTGRTTVIVLLPRWPPRRWWDVRSGAGCCWRLSDRRAHIIDGLPGLDTEKRHCSGRRPALQFLVNSVVMDVCTKLIEAIVHLLVPRVLDRTAGRSVVNCPACGKKAALTRWAPTAVQVVAWVGVLVFSLGFTGTLLVSAVFVIMVVAAFGGGFDGVGFSSGGALVSVGAVLVGAVVTMLAGAAGLAWYHSFPPKLCNGCGAHWPRPEPGVPFVAPIQPPSTPTTTFRCRCGQALRVPARQAGATVRCPRCGLVQPAHRRTWQPEHIALRLTYRLALAGGLAGMLYIYCGGGFARLDSGALVDVTPLWFLPSVFGLYGMTYQRANRLLAEGREEAYQKLFRTFGIVGAIGLPPFLLRRWRDRSIVVAVAGTLYWGVLLWLFFAVIFPKL